MPHGSRRFESFKHGDWYGYEDNVAMEIDTRFTLRNGVGDSLRSPIGLGLGVGFYGKPWGRKIGAQRKFRLTCLNTKICMVASPKFKYLGKISTIWCRNQFMRPICEYMT